MPLSSGDSLPIMTSFIVLLMLSDVIIAGYGQLSLGVGGVGGRCERITIPLCRDMKYNMTRMPNLIGHNSQKDATLQVNEFIPLVQFGCSRFLKFFLCSLYAPMCTEQVDETLVIPACRSMCLEVKSKCEPVLERFSFHWPPVLDCGRLPERSDRTQLCIDPPDTGDDDVIEQAASDDSLFESMTHNPEMIRLLEILRNGGGGSGAGLGSTFDPMKFQHLPPASVGGPGVGGINVDVRGRDQTVSHGQKHIAATSCGQRYVALVGNHANETVCAARCGIDVLYKESDKRFAEVWVTVWSVICLVLTSLTFITYLMDTSRFRYPERPVVMLAACSALHCCTYLLRAGINRNLISCDTSARHLLHDGLANTWCVVTFLISYFFLTASSVWWVALAVAFFLSAARRWSREAIESRTAAYFHVVAWSVPAVMTVAILALRRVDADELTGLCLVGNLDENSLITFIILPWLIFLVIGVLFVAVGFVAMFRIRRDLVKRSSASGVGVLGDPVVGPTEIKSLEKLMMKVGVFSVLYTVPAVCLLACFIHQRINMMRWKQISSVTDCKTSLHNVIDCSLTESLAPVEVQILKLSSMILTGTTSSMWICTTKTFHTWSSWFATRLPRLQRRPDGAVKQSRILAPVRMTSLRGGADVTTISGGGQYRKCGDPASSQLLQTSMSCPRTRV